MSAQCRHNMRSSAYGCTYYLPAVLRNPSLNQDFCRSSYGTDGRTGGRTGKTRNAAYEDGRMITNYRCTLPRNLHVYEI